MTEYPKPDLDSRAFHCSGCRFVNLNFNDVNENVVLNTPVVCLFKRDALKKYINFVEGKLVNKTTIEMKVVDDKGRSGNIYIAAFPKEGKIKENLISFQVENTFCWHCAKLNGATKEQEKIYKELMKKEPDNARLAKDGIQFLKEEFKNARKRKEPSSIVSSIPYSVFEKVRNYVTDRNNYMYSEYGSSSNLIFLEPSIYWSAVVSMSSTASPKQKSPTYQLEEDKELYGTCKNLSSDKKYSNRDKPPYEANACKGKQRKGNDGRLYISVPLNYELKNFTWKDYVPGKKYPLLEKYIDRYFSVDDDDDYDE